MNQTEKNNLGNRDWCVYKHTNLINGKVYIGKTSKKPEHRWNNGKGYFYQKHFYNSIKKYGWDEGFSHEIIKSGLNSDEASQLEKDLIKQYNSMDPAKGYNQTAGGEGMLGWHHTEESKAKIVLSNQTRTISEESRKKNAESQRRHIAQTGVIPFKGSHHSSEAKAIMSKKMKARIEKNGVITEKCVLQYDLEGRYLQEYKSLKLAAEDVGVNSSTIWACLTEKCRSAGGYQWRYKESENISQNIGKVHKRYRQGKDNPMYGKHSSDNPNSKKVEQYDMSGNFIAEYDSVMDAKKATGLNNAAIGMCCNQRTKSSGGYVWKWKDLSK